MFDKLDAVAMTSAEKKLSKATKKTLGEMHIALIKDEAVTITLFGLAHVKVKQTQEDVIKSVHEYLVTWASDAEKVKLADDLLRDSPILQHALILIRATH